MRTHRFSIALDALDPDSDDFEDKLFEAGCDDALVTYRRGVVLLEFAREAKSVAHAIISAVEDVKTAGGRVLWVAPDSLANRATLLTAPG